MQERWWLNSPMRERHTLSHFEQTYDCVESFAVVRSFLRLRFSLAWALRFSSKDDTPRRTSSRHETRLEARSSHSVWFSPEEFREVLSSSLNLFLGVPMFRLPSRSSPNIICFGKRLLSILATWPAQRSLFLSSKASMLFSLAFSKVSTSETWSHQRIFSMERRQRWWKRSRILIWCL